MSRHLALAALALAPLLSAQHESMPPGMSHEEHMQQMNKRGNAAMGFDQDKVTHRFVLTESGGRIEVSVQRATDDATRRQIRDHLKTISREFADGVFTSPTATHGEVPPGVPVMRELKSRIAYKYEETPEGARVIITTADRTALSALHNFLKYQIREHMKSNRRDLAEEIRFLSTFDAAVARTMDIVDMPDRRASLLVSLILQNQGALAKKRRSEFEELSDAELASIEAAIAEVTAP